MTRLSNQQRSQSSNRMNSSRKARPFYPIDHTVHPRCASLDCPSTPIHEPFPQRINPANVDPSDSLSTHCLRLVVSDLIFNLSQLEPDVLNLLKKAALALAMTAIFNFQSLLLVILLFICTSTYVHGIWPSLLDRNKDGPLGVFWKSARIGERLSPYVGLLCVVMAGYYLTGGA